MEEELLALENARDLGETHQRTKATNKAVRKAMKQYGIDSVEDVERMQDEIRVRGRPRCGVCDAGMQLLVVALVFFFFFFFFFPLSLSLSLPIRFSCAPTLVSLVPPPGAQRAPR